MSAQLKPLQFAARRPEYDNYFLGSEQDWIHSNDELLRKWFKECSSYVGAPMTEADFQGFARAQHDVQMMFRNQMKQTLRHYA